MYEIILTTINLIIALSVLNVWLVRFNRPTVYRGGDAVSMKEEFDEYGLPNWSMYLVGATKVIISLILILSIFDITTINLKSCYYILSLLMIGAIFMHIKIKDPIKKSIPASIILSLLVILILS